MATPSARTTYDPTVPLDVARVPLERFHAHVIHCIAQHSFCVLRVSRPVAASFREATDAAQRFFSAVPEKRKLATRKLYKEVEEAAAVAAATSAGAAALDRGCGGSCSARTQPGKRKAEQLADTGAQPCGARVKNDTVAGLWGYSTPTSAKQLFRMRRGPVCEWPARPRNFKAAMLTAMGHLEDLNYAVLSVVLAGVAAVSREEAAEGCGVHATAAAEQVEAPAKACSCGAAKQLDADALLAAYTSVDHLDAAGGAYLHSPFDAFLYHNSHHDLSTRKRWRRRAKDEETGAVPVPSPNCLAHVDPGFLSCIPVADTPGLMIMDASSRQWVDVEALPGVQPLQDVVIFSGWSLQVASAHRVPAAVHLVRSAPAPRLSLVYERRQEDGGDGWDMPPARTQRAPDTALARSASSKPCS